MTLFPQYLMRQAAMAKQQLDDEAKAQDEKEPTISPSKLSQPKTPGGLSQRTLSRQPTMNSIDTRKIPRSPKVAPEPNIDYKMFPITSWRTWNEPSDSDSFWLDRLSRWLFPLLYFIFGMWIHCLFNKLHLRPTSDVIVS